MVEDCPRRDGSGGYGMTYPTSIHYTWGLSESCHTIEITSMRPVLKKGADRPEDEVPSRVCLIECPVKRLQARSSVLLKGQLVGRGHDPGCCKDD